MAGMVTKMLQDSRRGEGLTEAQVAHRIGVPVATYRAFEAGGQAPRWDAYDRICKLFGWPQTFARER